MRKKYAHHRAQWIMTRRDIFLLFSCTRVFNQIVKASFYGVWLHWRICILGRLRENQVQQFLNSVGPDSGTEGLQQPSLILLPRKRVQSASHILENCWGHLTSWQDTFPRIGATQSHPLRLSCHRLPPFCLDIPPRISHPTSRGQARIDIVSRRICSFNSLSLFSSRI